jgi:hypothetical protein
MFDSRRCPNASQSFATSTRMPCLSISLATEAQGTGFLNVYDGLRLVRIQGWGQNYLPLAAASYDAFGRPLALELGGGCPTSTTSSGRSS